MKTKIKYINDNDEGLFVCENCGFSKQFKATKFKNSKKNVKTVCSKCGHLNRFTLEFRTCYRKETNFFGTCEYKKINRNKTITILIKNISKTGLGFVVLKKEFLALLSIGNKVKIKFKLNNTRQNILINKEGIIKSIVDDYVGIQFCDITYQKEIGFFLMD